MRLLCAAAMSLSLGLFVAYADDKKAADPKPDRAEALKTLQKKFNDEMNDLITRFNKASTPAEKNGIREEARELGAITAQKAIVIAEENPKDATGFEAAMFVLKNRRDGKESEKALTIISENHLNNPKVKEILPMLASMPAGQKLLTTIAEKGTDKDVKGMAYFFLGSAAADQVDDEEDEKKVNELIAKATDYFDKAAKTAPDAKIGASTIAKEATSQLEGLKAVTALAIGKPAPDVESVNLDGKKVKLSDYKGKVVLFDIWATWCPPCRAMIPHERDMVEKMKKDKKPFEMISVSADNKKDTLVKFIEKEPMPWTHWWDNGPESPVLKKYRVRAFPTLYLIDHKGIIRHKWVGSPGNEKIDKAVDELVTEAAKAKG